MFIVYSVKRNIEQDMIDLYDWIVFGVPFVVQGSNPKY